MGSDLKLRRILWSAALAVLAARSAALSAEPVGSAPPAAQSGRVLPGDATVVHGDVSFQQPSPDTLRVHQASDKAIVNWTSFDIGKGYTVDVLQPNATSAMLARVTGQTDTRLAGTLTANGRFVLINPNGIVIDGGARIDTGAFTASTLDIADADFLSGKMVFRRTGEARSVVNAGTITARDGEVALLGSAVVNEGLVSARLGRVALGAGDAITLDFSGEHFLQVAVPVSEAAGLVDALGRPLEALVNMPGRIEAEGGRILLSASAARGLMLGAVRIDGDLIATSARSEGGVIRLGSIGVDGGDGLVQVAGRLEANGGAGLDGGSIAIRGGAVALGGVVDASGDRDGGRVDVTASRVLSLAGSVGAVGLRGTGGVIDYFSAGGLMENTYGLSDVSGGISGGSIRVTAAGDLATSGTYRADGLLGLGGRIDMTAPSVRLLSTSLSARGLQQGGLVRIGGAFQGGATERLARTDFQAFEGRFGALPDIANAYNTFVNDGVTIDVGSARGHGGTAVVWSDSLTTMLGSISAAGRLGGGYAEVSGKDTLRYVDLARIDTGQGGSLLLDPRNIVIGDLAQASAWQYAAVIGAGVVPSALGMGALQPTDLFGQSVALNAAGDRLVVGATGDGGLGNISPTSGAVRLFTFTDTRFGGGRLVGIIGRGYTGSGNLDLGVGLGTQDNFGSSVALNALGNRLAVGAVYDDGNTSYVENLGSVRLFTFTNNSFGGAALSATIGRGYTGGKNIDLGSALGAGDEFGSAVALNAAGDRLAVGAWGDDGFGDVSSNSGSVRLFTFTDTSFSGGALAGTIGRGYAGGGDLDLGSALGGGANLGVALALNGVGDRLAVGASRDDGFGAVSADSGAVRLFTFTNNSFGGAALSATIGRGYTGGKNIDLGSTLGARDEFGVAVALNAAGDRLAVGAWGDDGFGNLVDGSGAVRLFTFTDTSFSGGALAGTIGRGYIGERDVDLSTGLDVLDSFGRSVAFNAAGDRLAVGATGDDGLGGVSNGTGAVRLFAFTDSDFRGGVLVDTLGYGYSSGYTVGVGQIIEASDRFGSAVALNAAGDRLAVGAPGDDGFGNLVDGSGAVRLFTFTDTSFSGAALVGTLGSGYTGTGNLDLRSVLERFDAFGSSLALNAAGTRLVVGATGDDGAGNISGGSGAVHLFSFADTVFGGPSLVGTIGRGYTGAGDLDLGSALGASDGFGIAVALNAAGDRLAVGAYGDDGFGNVATNSGSVRLFSFADTTFGGGSLVGTIGRGYTGAGDIDLGTALDSNDWFGYSIALNAAGNRLAVGAFYDDGFGELFTDSGSVRLFSFADTSFGGGSLVGTIGRGYTGAGNFDTGSVVESFDSFGSGVALNGAGNRLVVGAEGDDGSGNSPGSTGAVHLFTFSNTDFGGAARVGTIGRGYSGGASVNVGLETADWFGISVALNAAGDRLAVGSTDAGVGNLATNVGSVRLFSFTNTSFAGGSLIGNIGHGYTNTGDLDLSSAIASEDGFGTSLALNAAGDLLAVGAPTDDGFGNLFTNTGAVRLFRFGNTAFGSASLVGTIGRGYLGAGNLDLGVALAVDDQFGRSVALNAAGDRLAVGAWGDDGFGDVATSSGSVRLFSFADTTFGGGSLVGTIGRGYTGAGDLDLGVALAVVDLFGTSVALNAAGDRLAVGAYGDDGFGDVATNSGSVRLFSFADTTFGGGSLVGTIGRGYTGAGDLDLGEALTADDQFGYSVALNAAGDRLAVGAPRDDGRLNNWTDSGSVRLFSFADSSFGGGSLVGTIGRDYTGAGNLDHGCCSSERFGESVALNGAGDLLAAGSFRGLSGGGYVSVFRFAGPVFAGATRQSRIGHSFASPGDFNLQPAGFTGVGGAVAMDASGKRLALGSTQGVLLLTDFSGGVVSSLAFGDNATGTSNVSASALAQFLSTGQSISFEASNDITVNSALTVSNSSGNGGAMTLRAGRSILLNANIVTDNGALTLEANTGGSDLATVNANRSTGAAEITMASGVSINAGTGAFSARIFPGAGLITPTSGDITLGSITAGSISVSNAGPTAGSDIIVRPGAVFTASGTGRAIDIRAETGTFTNNAGAGLFNLTGGGTYGVFSDAPSSTLEGVTGYLKRYNVANAGAFAGLSPGGSFFAYRLAPVLTVTANAATRQYGAANPTFTSNISGFIDGDSGANIGGAASLSTAAGATSGVGDYTYGITQGSLAASSNYALTYTGADLTVTARPITVTADALSRIYGNANPALTYTVGGQGLVNGDTLSGGLSTSATTASNVGTYGITQGSLAATSNYALTYTGADLTVTARPITVTADALSRIYGNANPALTYTVGGQGLVNGDVLSGGLATSATTASNVGTYGITQGNLAATSNYALTYTGADLTVTPRPIIVTADDLRKLLGQPDPALTYRLGGQGLVNGDTLLGALSRAPGESVGSYLIDIGNLRNPNYLISFVAGQLVIQPVETRSPLSLAPSISESAIEQPVVAGMVIASADVVPRAPESLTGLAATAEADTRVGSGAGGCTLASGGVCLQLDQ
jgi:filamentous hemagglutinin family protein